MTTRALTSKAIAVIKSPPIADNSIEPKPPRKPRPLPTFALWEKFTELERSADAVLEACEAYIGGRDECILNASVRDALKASKELHGFFDDVLKPFVVGGWIGGGADDVATKKSAISSRVGMMVAAFPNGAPVSAENYIHTLVNHINDREPDPYVIESTCREVERTRTFRPAPAEILPILEEQAELWSRRWRAIDLVSHWRLKATKAKPKPEGG